MKIISALIIAFSLILVCANGCGSSEKENPSPTTTPTVTPTAETSRFEISLEDYPSATGIPASELRWDFSSETDYKYVYEQSIIVNTSYTMEEIDNSSQKAEGIGDLIIKSQEDGTANLVLENLHLTAEMNLGDEDEPSTMEQTAPTMVVPGMEEDGSMNTGDSEQETLFKLIFPLPPEPLEVGESVSVPVQMPFNIFGSPLWVDGSMNITLEGYVNIAGITCAKLSTNINISHLEIPEEIAGEYFCSAIGNGESYFAVEDGKFYSGQLVLIMQMTADAPMPEMGSGENGFDMPDRIQMEFISDNWIRISANE